MAQKTGKEETEFKVVPEALSLCVNNCGLTGNPATKNMCQKCFNNTIIASHKASSAVSKTSTSSLSRFLDLPDKLPSKENSGQDLKRSDQHVPDEGQISVKRMVNRCSGCRRKVGLTGFRCRCGELFCSDHRYSDRHGCSFDYKAAGREAIARDNPVVKVAKIAKL